MNLTAIAPRNIIFDQDRRPDEAVVEAIAEEGLYDTPRGPSGIRDTIAVRRHSNNTFRVVKGADELRAVAALLNSNADCHDPVTGRSVKACDLYKTIGVVVFD